MGRPRKQTADFFPHYVGGSRKTIFVLENRWGNDGYAFWFKLLEILCQSDGHYYECSKQADMDYFTAFVKLPEATVLEIMAMLAEREKIDRELWEQHRTIWCQSLVDNLSALYSKRTVSAPEKPVFGEFSPRKSTETDVSGDGNPQSRTEDIRTEEKGTEDKEAEQIQEQGGKPPEPALPPCLYEKIMQLYNTTCVSLSKVKSIEGKRRTAVAARWKQHKTLDIFSELFQITEASDFLKGNNERNWTATFDWLMNANNFSKVLEHLYDNKSKGGTSSGANWGHTQPKQSDGFKPSGGFRKE